MKTRRPFRRRISLQERRAKPNLRCAPSDLFDSLNAWSAYYEYNQREHDQCALWLNPWGYALCEECDESIDYVQDGWNFDGPGRREIIWIEDVAMDYWSSDYSGYVIIDEYQGSTTYTYYDIPLHAGPYARWSVFLGKVYVPTRPRGIL